MGRSKSLAQNSRAKENWQKEKGQKEIGMSKEKGIGKRQRPKKNGKVNGKGQCKI